MSMSLAQAEVRELLHAFAFVRFGDEEVALRIDREVVRAVELAGPVPRPAEFTDHPQRLPLEDVDALIRAVGNDEKRLPRIGREADVPDRPAAEGLTGDHDLADERAILPKNLNAIVRAIADVDEAVL